MPIQQTCQYCGALTDVCEEGDGRKGTCPTCGKMMTIHVSASTRAKKHRQPVSELKFGPPLIGIVCVGALLCLLEVGLGVCFMVVGVILLLAVLLLGLLLSWVVRKLVPAKSQFEDSLPERMIVTAMNWGAWLVLGVALLAAVLPAITHSPEPVRRAVCLINLRNIGQAMLHYRDANGHFPPAYIVDDKGNSLHSWRVLLLPYLGEDDYRALWKQVKLDEPWNSPHNKAVFDSVDTPEIYQCPSAPDAPEETNYVMIVGPQTISDGASSVREEDIVDGPGSTIMAVEVATSGIHWAEPRDLRGEEIEWHINQLRGKGISSYHSGVVNIVFCDGSVYSVWDSTDPKLIKAMTTIAGGEDVSEFFEDGRVEQIRFPHTTTPVTTD